jgi:hypothetical protein
MSRTGWTHRGGRGTDLSKSDGATHKLVVGYCWTSTPAGAAAIYFVMVVPEAPGSKPCTDNDVTVMMGQQDGRRHASF